ncbi:MULTISPECIES: succinylglutamate desuccinylase/aspartoacylase family protein [unclassified Roseitalea]|uniref:succinylglutamate desuccinylase/aspartoacylase family protein n=1 Tax=unclassified Roseitalea TaxID=2639107 RepID=UPI00273DD8EE|nr:MULTISPECIES: succinylglutamate desuccinylase/aspartoacylase family protein [unclassified Roseitalea]
MGTDIGWTDIDFDRPGKQTGFFNLPNSVHDDAWGVVPIPLTVIANGSGPTIILQGGNHGDEYEGPIVLGELIRDLDPATISGRLIIVPAINLPAVEAASRVSPVDGLNMNRTFPGDRLGSLTRQITAFVHDTLFAMADAFVDLHSGGSSLAIVPAAIVEPSENAELARKNREAVMAFGAPMNVVISNYGDPRTSTASAVRAGLVTVGTEMAGAGTVTPEAVRVCRRGVRNLLVHFGVTEGQIERPQTASGELHAIAGTHSYVIAPSHGVFEPYHELGATVRAGEPAGRVHALADPASPPRELAFGADGIVFGRRHFGRVRPGNCCLVVASPTE